MLIASRSGTWFSFILRTAVSREVTIRMELEPSDLVTSDLVNSDLRLWPVEGAVTDAPSLKLQEQH